MRRGMHLAVAMLVVLCSINVGQAIPRLINY